MLLLGHCGAEYEGMRYLAEWMTENIIETKYLHCGGLYSGIDNDSMLMR